ncbi:hypothetical protein GCM10010840_17960 [Deinococcus aerolatus]|uniref:Ig-like domain-containing protein n=1 Tax=Deinococcus aerolatus TaxID=522487 RepID=A0ABQ2G8Q7_9DEIO|nr:Ig-like domain-containing protein [Deinococcus aerolatus]GGL80530.1 hypothetical protein GCM10010840_17960 [Deinococcus aerolatus]
MSTARRNPLLLLLTGILVACGGGSTPGTAPSGNTAPAVSIKASGRAITSSTYLPSRGRLEVGVSDPDMGGSIKKVVYSLDNGSQTELAASAAMTVQLPDLSGGAHEVTVEATDNVGAVTTIKAPFLVDAAAPSLDTITLNGQAAVSTATLTVGDAALLSVSAQDTRGDTQNTAGPVTIRILEGGTLLKSVSGTSTTVDVTKASGNKDRTAGVVAFTVEAEDSVGFVTSRTISVTFNAAANSSTITAPTFTWLSPASDYVQGGGTITLRATATRNGQDLSSQIAYTATCGTIVGNIWTLGDDCADGSKQSVTATVTDGGRSFSSPAKVITVDASNPTVQITSPQQGQGFTQNPIKISVTGTDAVSGLDRILVEASANGKDFVQVGVITSASGDVTWAPMNGTYTLRATATDKTGRTSSTTVSEIKVQLTSNDATPPTVSFSPIPTGPQRAITTIVVLASDIGVDASGVAKVDLYDGGTLIESKTAGVGGKYTFSLDTTRLSDGTHALRAVAFDNAGLSSEAGATLTVDNTAPIISWISPASGAVTRGKVTLNATTNEGKVTYTVDGDAITGTTVEFKNDGAHTITATAKDDAGNTTTSTITVTSDATAPTAQIISPTSGSTLTSNPVTVNVSGNDAGSGVASLEVFAGSTSIGTVNGAGGSVTWAPSTGIYKLTVIATDKAGNRSIAGTPVTVEMKLAIADTSGPEFLAASPTIQPAPTNGNSRGSVIIDGLVKDPETGISQVALFNGGTRLNAPASLSQQPDGSVRYALALDTRTLNDGEYSLTIQATNGIGLINNKEIKIQVNNSAPTVTITNPQNGALLGTASDLAVKATSTDTTPDDVVALTYSVDGGAFGDTSTLPKTDGVHTLTVRATDKAGNTGSATSTFTYDGTAPIVQITSPTAGQKFTTTPISIGVVGQDSGTGIAKIEVYADDGTHELIGTSNGSGTVTWYPRKTNGTPYKIVAIATDRAGNNAETTIEKVQVQTASSITLASEPTIKLPDANPKGALLLTPNRLYVRGPLDIAAEATTTAPNMVQADLLLDGQTRATNTTTPSKPTFNFDFDTLNEGLHDVGVRFTDSLGTVGSTKTSVFVDKTGPVITWNTPLNGSLSNKEVAPSASASDNASGFTGAVTFNENGIDITGPVGEGQHTIMAVAKDNLGNTSTKAISFTVDMTGPAVVPTSPTDNQEFASAPITLSASASDNLSGVAYVEAKVGVKGQPLTTLGRQNGPTYSAVYTPTQSGTYEVEYTAWDAAGNASSIIKRTFQYSVTAAPVEQAPKPVLEVIGSAPFSGNISVNVSGNFHTSSQVDRMILQVTDAKGVIDNSTYVTTQARATFSVDTTRFANGLLKLQVIAIAKSGLIGNSDVFEGGVQNLTSPDLKVATPSDGAIITTPTVPVQITLTKRSADYSVTGSNIVVDVLDYRGVSVRSQTLSTNNPSICTGSAESLTCNTSFDIAALPADIYSIRVRANVQVDPSGVNITRALETTSRFTHNTASLLPPAASIRFPAITDLQKPSQLDSSSGVLISVSDNTGVSVVEARIVGPFDGTQPLTLNGTTQCDASVPVAGRSPVDVLMLNYGYASPITNGDVVLRNLDIDGSAYIPNNNPNERYDLRVTVQDTEGNRNIQCIPVTVNRAASQASRPTYVASTTKLPNPPSTTPGELNYTTGTWRISGMTNSSRVAAVLYQDNIQKTVTFESGVTTSKDMTVSFGDPGTYQIVWLIEDMTTGIVTSVSGEVISVVKISKP